MVRGRTIARRGGAKRRLTLSKRLMGVLVLCVGAIVVLLVTGATSATPRPGGVGRPADRRAPRISGVAREGRTLHASSGRWVRARKFAYEWKRCNVRGAKCRLITRPRAKRGKPRPRPDAYALTRADVGHRIRVTVVASNRRGRTAVTSRLTAVVRRESAAKSPAPSLGGPPPSPSPHGLRVVGNTLVNGNGQTVVLHGTDVGGSSYACERGAYGFSDTPTGDSLYGPMVGNDNGALAKNWSINSVTLGLNQDCWLGINGVAAKYSGQNYINYVKGEVASMEKYGIYPTLTFFVGEPGTDTPNWNSTGNGNAPMPDNDHVPLFWEEVANTFKSDPNVIFRLYEEPYPENTGTNLATWKCWSRGDVQYSTSSDQTPPTAPTPVSSTQNCSPLNSDAQGHAYSSVGMQSLVNIIRGAGASNVIQIPGVAFADMLACSNTGSPTSCGFLDSADGVRVTDPVSASSPQLMADVDNYPDAGQICENMTCFDDTYAAVAKVMPIDAGEIGVENNSNPFPIVQQFVNAYDSLGQSYYGSQWESWTYLVSNYNGAPVSGWGTWFYDHITGQS
jgi:endoglucanase